MDAADEMQPAFKRPALAERLEAAAARQEVVMSEAAAGDESSRICPHIPKRPWQQEDALKDTGGWPGCGPTEVLQFYGLAVEEFIKHWDLQDAHGSYWYQRWPTQQGNPPPCTLHEMPIQAMKLLPGKTFFYIDEMVNSIQQRVNGTDKEPLLFELFAGVAHTGYGGSGEWGQKFQYFQLEDLFGGPPYITGVKMFTHGEYHETRDFLKATKADDNCYCLCEVMQDGESELGWSLVIHEIQPVSWETMRCAHASIGKTTGEGVVERQTTMCMGEDFW